MAKCVFCDYDGPLTKEHVLPKWLREVYPPGPSGVTTTREQGPNNVQYETYSHTGKTYDITVRAVCATCNNGWMARLEGKAKPVLSRMIHGGETRLNATARKLIARWAVKTIVVAQAKDEGACVPPEHYAQLRDAEVAPPGTAVWVGAGDPGPNGLVYLRHNGVQLTGSDTGAVLLGYSGTLAVGRLLLQVFGNDPAEELTRQLAPNTASALREVWPPPAPTTTWPPQVTVGPNALDSFANSMLPKGSVAILSPEAK